MKKDFYKEYWGCPDCGYINPIYNPDRKRKELLKYCQKCRKKRPIRVL